MRVEADGRFAEEACTIESRPTPAAAAAIPDALDIPDGATLSYFGCPLYRSRQRVRAAGVMAFKGMALPSPAKKDEHGRDLAFVARRWCLIHMPGKISAHTPEGSIIAKTTYGMSGIVLAAGAWPTCRGKISEYSLEYPIKAKSTVCMLGIVDSTCTPGRAPIHIQGTTHA